MIFVQVPLLALVYATPRGKHAQHLIHGSLAEILRDHQAYKVIYVRQPLAGPMPDRHLAVKTAGADLRTRLFNILCVGIQSLNDIRITGTKCGGQLPVPATEMDHQPATNAGRLDDRTAFILRHG